MTTLAAISDQSSIDDQWIGLIGVLACVLLIVTLGVIERRRQVAAKEAAAAQLLRRHRLHLRPALPPLHPEGHDMSWLSDLTSTPAKVFCTFSGGHDFVRAGSYLVCHFCGHKVSVR